MTNNTEVQIFSPKERFWFQQNQKLIANPQFLDSLGDLYDDELYFKHYGGGKTTLDFSVFDLEHICTDNVATLRLDSSTYALTLKEYAKLAVINNITSKSIRGALPAYSMMMHIGAFLKSDNNQMLRLLNIEAFHISFLTQTITKNGWFTRLSPPAFNPTYNNFCFIKIRRTLHALGVQGVLDPRLMKQQVMSTLDTACRSIMAISRNEYQKGGNFNALTLEMGQYYTDHLKNVYENNYLFSLVCQSAISKLSKRAGDFLVNRYSVIADTILGSFIPNKSTRSEKFSRNSIHTDLKSTLFSEYKKCFDKVESLKEEYIIEVVKELGLTLRFDAVEIIRVLMLQRYYNFGSSKTPDAVWQDYLLSLDKTEVDLNRLKESTANDVYEKMSIVITEHRLERAEFLPALSQWAKGLLDDKQNVTYVNLKNAFNRVNDAMTTLVVAYLGYRKSEFGFPLSAINVEPNLDVLDSAHIPFRFKLKWLVPKTNGTTKVNREITSQCYQLSAQLNEVHQAPEGEPCLYADARNTVETSHKSTLYIDLKVKSNWSHFVTNYQPFVDTSELQRLYHLPDGQLTNLERARLVRLREQYDLNSARVSHLVATSKKVKQDIKVLQCTGFAGDKAQKRFKRSLVEYQEKGSITNKLHLEVVNQYLSDETKQWLRSGEGDLQNKSMLDISNELTRDVRYPTPHAFRHIWAESVLMRYQGDVGAVIRHQFCHLNDSFFMSYLRDKEARNLMQAARMKVLNSIVDTLLVESHKIGSEYVGGFSHFVKKAVSLTQAFTSNDIRILRDRIAGRVISIQPMRFATCVPREGAEARAKCALMGYINPHNAKPSFCLDCPNAIITSGNIQGIWVTIQPFVKECLNTDIMGFMVESHLPTLRSAYKRIKSLALDSQKDSVGRVLSFIDKAIKSVEKRLEEEEGLYA